MNKVIKLAGFVMLATISAGATVISAACAVDQVENILNLLAKKRNN